MEKNNLEQLLEGWERALTSYGTPIDFVDGSFVYLLKNPKNSVEIPLRVIYAPGFSMRSELMKGQKEEAIKRKEENLPSRWKNDGNACFLCDNVGQAKDTGSNLLLPCDSYGNCILVPNRYPAVKGHLLLCSKEHDFPESLAEEIASSSEISRDYGLVFLRHHPLAGMSIPNHGHSHMYPREITLRNGSKAKFHGLDGCALIDSGFDKDVAFIERTRFDTLAIFGKNAETKLMKTIKKLQEEGSIFTFSYIPDEKNGGTYFLDVHLQIDEDKYLCGGSSAYLRHHFGNRKIDYESQMQNEMRCLPMRGSFNWRRYFA